jgi:hypothetical protein
MMRQLSILIVCAYAFLASFSSEASAGTIEGTVTPTEWAPETEVCVVGTSLCAIPASSGAYEIPRVIGHGLTVEFIPPYRSGLMPQYYNHKGTVGEATPITVPEYGSKPNVDGDLLEGGTVEGVVTGSDGPELNEVEVCAKAATGESFCAETDASGFYEIHSLPTGFYSIGFWGVGRSAEYVATSSSLAAVIEGGATAGVDATMAKGSAVEGQVTTTSSGAPLGGIDVCLFGVSASTAQRCVFTDDAGAYRFQGLAAGSYQVGFSLEPDEIGGLTVIGGADGYESQYYADADTRAQARAIAVLGPSVTAGIDAALATPALAPSPLPPFAPVNQIVFAPTVVPIPATKTVGCKKGLKKEKVKGKVRCVKPKPKAKKKHKEHKHRKPSRKKSSGQKAGDEKKGGKR